MRLFKHSLATALMSLAALPAFAQFQSAVPGVAPGVASPAYGVKKKVVCTATINSPEEKDSFQRYLHPDYFQFVELVAGKTDTKFLARTCAQNNVKCDVVLVSGHFGGGFTDNRNFFLSDNEMEKLSCSSCPSFLNDATMVYLFGCNTLASKQKSSRTPEEYARVLRDEVGLDSNDALATAAVRYSPLGDSFSDRLRRIFRGSAFIAGFGDKAPLGNQIEEQLGSYFRSLVPGIPATGPLDDSQRRLISEAYLKEIEAIAEGKASGRNAQIYTSGQRLQPLFADHVKGNYTDVMGIMAGTQEDFIAKNYCSFYESPAAKLRAIEAIVQTNDRGAVIQMLPYLLEMASRGKRAKTEQKALLARLAGNALLRDVVTGPEGVLTQLANAPHELLKTVDLATNLGWLSDAQSDVYYRQAAIFVWNHSEGLIKNKDLMSRISNEFLTVQASDLTPKAFEGNTIWELIQKYHKGDIAWIDLGRQNIDQSVKYQMRKYRAAEGEIRDYPLLSKEGVAMRRKKMADTGKHLNELCKILKGVKPLKAELSTLLAHRAQDFVTVGANKCSDLLQ
jgi:hypothetical protein